MNDEKFDEIIRNRVKNEIKIPNNLEQIVNDNLQMPKRKSKIKTFFTKVMQTIISILTIFAIGGGVYAGVTKTPILSLLGLTKAGETFETSSISVNKTIENKYAKVEFTRMACDNAVLILEYDVKFTELGLKEIKSNNYVQESYTNEIQRETIVTDYQAERWDERIIESDTDEYEAPKETLDLTGGIYVNGNLTEEYASYTEKVSESEYRLYQIILMNNKVEDLKIMVGAYYLKYNEVMLKFDDIYCFFIDASLKNNNINIQDKQVKIDNISINLSKISDTNIATIGKVKIEMTHLNNIQASSTTIDFSETNIEFKAIDENNNPIELDNRMIKNALATDNSEVYDMENEDEFITLKDATLKKEILLLFPEGVNDSSYIYLIPTLKGQEIGEKIKMNVEKISDTNVVINDIKIDTNYSDLALKYSTVLYEDNNEKNIYYNANAPKISLEDFEINGLKLKMTIDEAMKKLQDSYNKRNININCRDNLSDIENNRYCHYQDKYLELRFYLDDKGIISISSINLFDGTAWEKYGTTEKNLISKYYSNEYIEIFNEGMHQYKALYGKDLILKDFKGEKVEGEYAYICSDNNMDSYINYKNNDMNLGISIDPITKKITSIILDRQEVEETTDDDIDIY